jgi:hypothetical protein
MDIQLKLTLLLEIVKSNLFLNIINNAPALKEYGEFVLPFVLEEVEKNKEVLLFLIEQDPILSDLLEEIDVTALLEDPASQSPNIGQVITYLKTTTVMGEMERSIVDKLTVEVQKGSLDQQMQKKKKWFIFF